MAKDELITDLRTQLLEAKEQLGRRDQALRKLTASQKAKDAEIEDMKRTKNREIEDLRRTKDTEIEAIRAGDDPERHSRGTASRTSIFHHQYLFHSGDPVTDRSLPLSVKER